MEDLAAFEKTFWSLGPQFCPSNILCLGDYVDRGPHGFEVVAYLLAHKVLAPSKLHLLRGNHELSYLNKQFDFKSECEKKFGAAQGLEVWTAANSVFSVLPLAAIVDSKILCVHGGIPSPESLGGSALIPAIEAIPRELDLVCMEQNPLAWQLLWNDPVWSSETEQRLGADGFGPNSRRGSARVFSSEALSTFLAAHGLSHLIRAHQVMPDGFQLRYQAQLLTVFSSSRYCGVGNGSALVLVADGRLSVIRIAESKKRPRDS